MNDVTIMICFVVNYVLLCVLYFMQLSNLGIHKDFLQYMKNQNEINRLTVDNMDRLVNKLIEFNILGVSVDDFCNGSNDDFFDSLHSSSDYIHKPWYCDEDRKEKD